MTTHNRVSRAIIVFVLSFVSLVVVFPFYTMLMMGTYHSNELFTGIKVLPGKYLLQNIKSLMQINLLNAYKNSVLIAVGATSLGVFVCSLAGYTFAKFKFRLKKFFFTFILITMMIPMQLGIIAFVIEMRTIGWLGTLLPLIVPPAANAFGAFWMTQFTKGAIPNEVIESARIDGCGEFQIFLRIALPFMKPACITLGLLLFLWSWNNFFVPLVVVNSERLYPIALAIRRLSTQFQRDNAAQILGTTFGTVPALIFFAIFSKNLIRGLSAAAIKG